MANSPAHEGTHLIHDHVFKLLVEDRPREDVVHQGLPPSPGHEHVLAHITVPSFYQSLAIGGNVRRGGGGS